LPLTPSGIYYTVVGSGEPVVLLHGVTLDSRMWQHQLEPLRAAGYQAIAVDLRGHGRSAALADGVDSVADVCGVLDDAGVTRCHVIGLSMGGHEAVALAGRYPERVRSLVLADAWLPVPEMTWCPPVRTVRNEGLDAGRRAWLANPVFASAMQDPDLERAVATMVGENDLAIWTRRLRGPEPVPPSPAELVPAVQAPTQVIVGELDLPAFKAVSRWLQSTIPGAREYPVAAIAEAGHLSPMERPAAFNRVVLEFLGRLGSAS